jgi:tetraacyldisaccharide 4'-kinase
MKLLRTILLPVALCYGTVVFLRNLLFDAGILKVNRFKKKIISVGNLSTGGTGKTPHIEYLVKLLKDQYKVGVLSRGYGRSTSGFILSEINPAPKIIGDEPAQIKRKFPDVTVAVSASRATGLNRLYAKDDSPEVVLLDDAFQHRYVRPSLSLLLTEYGNLYSDDFVLPAGNLREFKMGSARAHSIIVTKTPQIFSPLERRLIIKKLKPEKCQNVYFSYFSYGELFEAFTQMPSKISKENCFRSNFSVVLVTGIARPEKLLHYLQDRGLKVKHIKFSDHHDFNSADINKIREIYNGISSENKLIITTEKDMVRLSEPSIRALAEDLPIFYLPVEVRFHGEDQMNFNNYILNHVREH